MVETKINAHAGKTYPKPRVSVPGQKYGHVMIDIETLGTSPGAVICSVAAVEFDIYSGNVGKRFYQKIEVESSVSVGLKYDWDTISWWLDQRREAWKEMFLDARPINQVLFALTHYIIGCERDEVCVWGNSARFDLGLLQAAYRAIGHEIPWDHRNERDVRTLVSFAPHVKKEMPFEGVKHNPIDDCLHQIAYCSEIYRQINR
jgi:hypothetical protein